MQLVQLWQCAVQLYKNANVIKDFLLHIPQHKIGDGTNGDKLGKPKKKTF